MQKLTLFSLMLASTATWAASIEPVLPLSGGTNTLTVLSMSGDGRTVVGYSSGTNGQEAFRWTASAGTVGLGDFAGGGFASSATGADFTGSKLCGSGTPDITRGFVLAAPSTTFQRLANLNGGSSISDKAYAISADGSVIVGASNSLAYGICGTVWTGNQLGEALPDIPGSSNFGEATAVNSDGTVIGGWGTGVNGFEAAVWDHGVLIALGDLPGGSFSSTVAAVSGDGKVAYGRGQTANSPTTFRWTAATGMVQLEPDMVGQIGFNSEPFGCNASGSVAALRVQNRAALWIEGVGTVYLSDLLANQGVSMSGYILNDARAISQDGLTVAGNAFVNGVICGYRARLNPTVMPGTLSGTVNLNDYSGDTLAVPIRVEIEDASSEIESGSTHLFSGNVLGWSTAQRGNCTLRVKAPHWLSKSISVNITNGSTHFGTLSLVNGDIDDDNEIGPNDFAMLAAAFGSSVGDSNFLASADLDGDDEVGPSDFAILSRNFGLSGD